MRKSWKWALCLGAVSLLLLGGCGKEKTEPVDLVLVTDGSEVASDAVYQSAWNGLAQYGDESGLKYEASVPAGRTTEDYENTIKEAAQKGASVIVCAGTSMSRAVYDAQRDWKDVRFLLLEAEPVSESGRSRLRGNTESLEIDVSEAGYLAGYAAVQAGYTHLGYIGQKNEENGTKYGTGYALGAEAAAADLGLGENSITLDYTYRKSSSVSPSYLEKIKSWYGEGGQILFSDGASIPNYEISEQFASTIKVMGWSEVANSLKLSDELLKSTLNCDAEKVAELIDKAHSDNTSILKYNDENSLSCVISLAYYSARKTYTIERELPAGKGVADLVFRPRKNNSNSAIIVELKYDSSAEGALEQIKKKQYTDCLKDYSGEILLVGINYQKDTKKHDCMIEKVYK